MKIFIGVSSVAYAILGASYAVVVLQRKSLLKNGEQILIHINFGVARARHEFSEYTPLRVDLKGAALVMAFWPILSVFMGGYGGGGGGKFPAPIDPPKKWHVSAPKKWHVSAPKNEHLDRAA